MDIFYVSIIKIHEVNEFKHTVVANLDTDCWGHKETGVLVVFDKHIWNRVKTQMQYLETEGHSPDSLEYFEGLSDEEYHKKFERTLKEFTDEELIEEFQKRMNRVGSKIQPVVTFKVKG